MSGRAIRPCAAPGCRKNASKHFCLEHYRASIKKAVRECEVCGDPILNRNISGRCIAHFNIQSAGRVPAKARMRARELAAQHTAPVAFINPDAGRGRNCLKTANGKVVLARISEELAVDLVHLTGADRSALFVDARAVAAVAMRARGASFTSIGMVLGERDHSTAMYLVRTFSERCERKPYLAVVAGRIAA